MSQNIRGATQCDNASDELLHSTASASQRHDAVFIDFSFMDDQLQTQKAKASMPAVLVTGPTVTQNSPFLP